MTIFFGTLIIVLLCCLAMGLGYVVEGRPFAGSCGGRAAGTPRCEGCPKRNRGGAAGKEIEGESGC